MSSVDAISEDPYVEVSKDYCKIRFPSVKYKSKIKPPTKPLDSTGTFVKQYDACTPLAHSEPLPTSATLRRDVSAYGTNGLVNAIAYAYYEHIPLVIRPDDVWIAILTQLAFYTEVHAEELRDQLVAHQGKKEILISDTRWSHVSQLKNDERLTGLIGEICEIIDREVKDSELKAWYTTSFSTSTETDHVVKKLLLMATLKKYFSYGFTHSCGFPLITLEGTREDWVSMREHVQFLKKFKRDQLSHWAEVMAYTLGYFVDAFDGKIDTHFWQSAVVEQEGYMSHDNSTIHGWLLAFAPFDKSADSYLAPLEEIKQKHIYTTRRVTHKSLVASTRTIDFTFTGADSKPHQLQFTAGIYDELVSTLEGNHNKVSSEEMECRMRSVWSLSYPRASQ